MSRIDEKARGRRVAKIVAKKPTVDDQLERLHSRWLAIKRLARILNRRKDADV